MGIKEVSAKRATELKKAYVKELEYVDLQLAKIFSDMKSKGVYDDAMIIITSDHGQAFNEHNFMYHGTHTYDELTNVH